MEFIESDLYSYFILPLLIFFARICDVTLGTLRIIFTSKGKKYIAPFLGFIEMIIWILAITHIFENLNNWACYIGFAAGFAMGNFVGIIVEERLAIGYELIRIITSKDAEDLISALREKGFGITSIRARGKKGDVGILYSIISRSYLKDFVSFMKKYNPRAFYTIEDIRFVNDKTFRPVNKSIVRKKLFKTKK
jgi:uncharacterized protein YebE (UPF0316 family)